MAVNLNMDIGELVKNLLQKKGGNLGAAATSADAAPYKNLVVASLGILSLIVVFLFAFYLPGHKANAKKQERYEKAQTMKSDLNNLDSKAKTLKQKLSTSRERYDSLLASFSDAGDLSSLYQSVSTLAAHDSLTVLNLKEAVDPKAKKDTTASLVKETKVSIELKGSFEAYMKFKEDMAASNSLLAINSESIKIADEKSEDSGLITIKLDISTYAIDKKPFLEAFANHEKK